MGEAPKASHVGTARLCGKADWAGPADAGDPVPAPTRRYMGAWKQQRVETAAHGTISA